MARRGITLGKDQLLKLEKKQAAGNQEQSGLRTNQLVQSGMNVLSSMKNINLPQEVSKIDKQETIHSRNPSQNLSHTSGEVSYQDPKSKKKRMNLADINQQQIASKLQKNQAENTKLGQQQSELPITMYRSALYDPEKQRRLQGGPSALANNVLPPFRFGVDDEDYDQEKGYKPEKDSVLGNFFPILKYVSPIYTSALTKLGPEKLKQEEEECKELLDGYKKIGKIVVEPYVNGKSIIKQDGKFSETNLAKKEQEELEKSKQKKKKKGEEEQKKQESIQKIQFERDAYVISFSPWFQNEETMFFKYSTLHQQFVDATAGEGGGQKIYGNKATALK